MERNVPGANMSKLKEAGVIDLTRHACWVLWYFVARLLRLQKRSVWKVSVLSTLCVLQRIWATSRGRTYYLSPFFCDRMVAPFIVLMQDFPIREIEAAAKRPVIARWFFTRTHISVSWLCWDEKTCVYFFVYCWSFICFPWAKQKEAAVFCNSDSWNDERGKGQTGAQCHIYLPRNSSIGARFYADTRGRGRGNMGLFHYPGVSWWILCYIDLWFSSYFGLFRFLCPRNKNIQCNALQFLF